jgi:hypothetical protein
LLPWKMGNALASRSTITASICGNGMLNRGDLGNLVF